MSPKQWRPFKPAGENFSAEMPAGGKQVILPLTSDGTANLNAYMVRDGWALYMTIWMTGPTGGETDRAVLDEAVGSFLEGIGEGYKSRGGHSFTCDLEHERKLSVAGYAGSEFEMPSCTVPGKLRVFTKVINGRRQMYIGASFYWREDPNVERFLKSFTVSSSVNPRARRSEN
jgi:hypothetical protein